MKLYRALVVLLAVLGALQTSAGALTALLGPQRAQEAGQIVAALGVLENVAAAVLHALAAPDAAPAPPPPPPPMGGAPGAA